MKKDATELLIDAIGAIHPQYVQEAEQWRGQAPQKSRGREGSGGGRCGLGYLLRLAAAAACFLLVMGGAALALRNAAPGGMSGESGQSAAGNAGAADEAAGGLEAGAGSAEGLSPGAEENGGGPAGAMGRPVAQIPEGTTEVEVIYYNGGREDRSLVEGDGLEGLRAWAASLELGEPVTFAEGEAPGAETDGGEIYQFRFKGGGFSYHNFGTCYLVVEDLWYPVQNPIAPPVW